MMSSDRKGEVPTPTRGWRVPPPGETRRGGHGVVPACLAMDPLTKRKIKRTLTPGTGAPIGGRPAQARNKNGAERDFRHHVVTRNRAGG